LRFLVNRLAVQFQRLRTNRWARLAVLFVLLLAISIGLAALFNNLLSPLEERLYNFSWLAYLIVFGTNLLSNLTVIAPVAIGASIMVSAATLWHPVVIAFFAALGGTIGELGGYYAGTLGKKVAFDDYPEAYDRVSDWVNRYGVWGIAFIAFQPVLPFDMAGLIAGASRMPVPKFMLACFAGKFPKYIIISYFFVQLADALPFLF
jgi:uncharacterized membrane protein YdjX (TVP38/TMEM64 family)